MNVLQICEARMIEHCYKCMYNENISAHIIASDIALSGKRKILIQVTNLHLFYITASSLSHCSDTDPFSHICHCVLGTVTKQ